MAGAKKSKEDLIFEKLFGLKPSEGRPIELTKIKVVSSEVPLPPVPKKRLVSRKILSLQPDRRCMDVIAKNWNKIRQAAFAECEVLNCYRGYSCEDILIETFEYVIRDEAAKEATEEEIFNLFMYCFDNLMWVAKMDKILEKKILSGREVDSTTYDNEGVTTE